MTRTQQVAFIQQAQHRLHDALEAHEDDRADDAYADLDCALHLPWIPEQRQPT